MTAKGIIINIAIVSKIALSLYINAKGAAGRVNIVKKLYIRPVFVRYTSVVLQSGQLKVFPSTLSIGAFNLDMGNFQPQAGQFLERFVFVSFIGLSHS
jgi:hypothetical protein